MVLGVTIREIKSECKLAGKTFKLTDYRLWVLHILTISVSLVCSGFDCCLTKEKNEEELMEDQTQRN